MYKLVDWCNIKHFSPTDAVIAATVLAYRKPTLVEGHCRPENGTKRENEEKKFIVSSTASARRPQIKLEVTN